MQDEPVVAVGLMTARDLELLGKGFRRYFPVSDAGQFQELLDAIDRAEAMRRQAAADASASPIQSLPRQEG